MSYVAAIQMTSTDSVSDNLKTVKRLSEMAVSQKASLIVLPETVAFVSAAEEGPKKIAEEEGNGPIQSFFSKLAKDLKVWIVGGTIPLKASDGRVFAACCVWNQEGHRVARYDKIHLFDVLVEETEYTESKNIYPGKEWVSVDSPVGKLGLSVCYDVRFPELYRKLFSDNVEILVIPSAFTEITGEAHWEPLLRARAIENLSYVIAANQQGVHPNGRSTYGHSMIIDPWGRVLAQLEKGEGVITAEVDLEYLANLRHRFPVSKHRKLQ